jgi:hypothetical protein
VGKEIIAPLTVAVELLFSKEIAGIEAVVELLNYAAPT